MLLNDYLFMQNNFESAESFLIVLKGIIGYSDYSLEMGYSNVFKPIEYSSVILMPHIYAL